MFQGLRTVIYHVPDLAAARGWYTATFGVAPYFDEPFYVGFEIGGYELGLHPAKPGTVTGDSVVAYWGVPECCSSVARERHVVARGGYPGAESAGAARRCRVTS